MSDQRDGGISWTEQTSARWCWACKVAHPLAAFGRDPSRGDGLARQCLASRRVKAPKQRTTYKRHGWLTPARSGDKKQARRRVNYLVERGRIPHPNSLPCIDCADEVYGLSFRHEYDHAKGYDTANQLYVEPVCSRCHHAREEARCG